MGVCRLLVVLGAVFSLVAPAAPAQSGTDLYGSARASALAGATTALIGDAGPHANPGLRAMAPERTVVLFVRESFGLAELRYGSVHVDLPVRGVTLSGGGSTFGFDAYREIHGNAGVATAVGLGTTRQLGAGVHVRYHHLRIDGFGRAGAAAVHAGLAVRVVPTLTFGVHTTNLFGARLSDGANLPKTLAVGLSYEGAESIHVVADAFKDIDFPLALRAGLELRPVPFVALRAGAASAPIRLALGTGVAVGGLRADVAAERHEALGWSPSASLQILW